MTAKARAEMGGKPKQPFASISRTRPCAVGERSVMLSPNRGRKAPRNTADAMRSATSFIAAETTLPPLERPTSTTSSRSSHTTERMIDSGVISARAWMVIRFLPDRVGWADGASTGDPDRRGERGRVASLGQA
jgi:hypothetical protein